MGNRIEIIGRTGTNSKVAVTGQTVVVEAKGDRRWLTITNISDTEITLGIGEAAVPGEGFPLAARATTKLDSLLEFPTKGNVMFNGKIYATTDRWDRYGQSSSTSSSSSSSAGGDPSGINDAKYLAICEF